VPSLLSGAFLDKNLEMDTRKGYTICSFMVNNSFKKYRVAIVGAGVIGLYLSWKLSKSGYQVTVFEKNSQVGQKPCSGLISERIKHLIPWDDSLAENKIDSCLIRFPGKEINLKFKPVHFAVCRQKLDQYLYRLAREAGAKILLGQRIEKMPSGFDKVIGCDGAFSFIRKNLSLPNPVFRLGIQGFMVEENRSSYVEVWPVKSGFFWKIPRGEKTEYGFIGDPKTTKQEFKQQLSILGQDDLENIKAAIIPQGLIIPKSKDVTLCGDAMGLCKPWSGGGVIWGLTAAEILIRNFPNFEKYHREVKRFFGFRILKGRLINNLVYFLGNNIPLTLPSRLTRDNDFPVF